MIISTYKSIRIISTSTIVFLLISTPSLGNLTIILVCDFKYVVYMFSFAQGALDNNMVKLVNKWVTFMYIGTQFTTLNETNSYRAHMAFYFFTLQVIF